MAYYYLISSLPTLKSDGEVPLSYDRFLEMCRTTVSSSKYEELRELSLLSSKGSLMSEWAKFYNTFKEELVFQRNQRLGRKTQPPSFRDEKASKLIATAISHPNPLIAEEMLLALQFDKLDEIIGIHYFDDYALMGYALKLKLLERKSIFKRESGRDEYNHIIDKLEEQIISMEQE